MIKHILSVYICWFATWL